MSKARCTECEKVMSQMDFDQHNCPAIPGPPKDDEGWDEYLKRCDAFKAEWKKKGGE